jgi:carboxylate-amine ligase
VAGTWTSSHPERVVPPTTAFGRGEAFSLGVEEELFLVDPASHALAHDAEQVIARLTVPRGTGDVHPDAYAALIELASPVSRHAEEAITALAALRARLRDVASTVIGCGLHPDAAFGDVVPFPAPRYRRIAADMRGLQTRTPTCALHVHVGMPDAETAIRACNALRGHLPLLQALAANSPFWHGRDSGFATARAQVFRAFPTSEIPPAFTSYEDYVAHVEEVAVAGDLPDYTFLWWDVRPHPRLGTVEVRAMDSQTSLASAAGLAALVHALARRAAEERGPWVAAEILMQSSFRAARDGLDATLWHDGALRPVRQIAEMTLAVARPYARDLSSEDILDEVERLLVEGNGAMRQRAAFARDGMPGVLADLVARTAGGAVTPA